MTLWENVLAHYGWQGAALAAVLVVLLCVQLWYYLFAYGRIPGYKNGRCSTPNRRCRSSSPCFRRTRSSSRSGFR